MVRAALFLLFLNALAARGQLWIHLASPDFDVYTNTGEGAARGILHEIDQVRQSLEAATHVTGPREGRIRVFVFRSAAEFRLYTASGIAPGATGFYHPGRNGGDLVISDSSQGFSTTVLHEYAHHFLHSTRIRIPLWYDEGFAELVAHRGEPIAARIAELRRGHMLTLTELAGVDHTSSEYQDPDKVDMFYSESWALVHMLHSSSSYGPELPRFLDLLLGGTPAVEAFDRVYGKTDEQVLAELERYIARERLPTVALRLQEFAPVKISNARLLTRTESAVILAELLIDLGRINSAERMLHKLARTSPTAPGVEVALGDVALASDRRMDAMAHYQRAIQSGSQDARPYLELASLLDDNAAIPLLEKAAALDPDYRDARKLLQSIRERRQPAAEPAIPAKRGPDVITPQSWQNPHGDTRVEGRLVWLNCEVSPAHLHIAAQGGELVLSIGDPYKIVIRNAPGLSTELPCGQMDRLASVEYVAGAGEITAIEFR